jgi:hypothetical protein
MGTSGDERRRAREGHCCWGIGFTNANCPPRAIAARWRDFPRPALAANEAPTLLFEPPHTPSWSRWPPPLGIRHALALGSFLQTLANPRRRFSHSESFDHRCRPETLRTAIATAFFWPTNTTSLLPLVRPV